MSEIILQHLNILVKKMMDKLEVNKYKLEVDGQSEGGDNYMGEIVFFRVISEDNRHTYNFVMKTAKRSEELRNSMPVVQAYNRELFMYSEIFPAFRNFIEETNPEFEFDCLAKCYHVDLSAKQETLIFENLKSNGYKLYERNKPWNLEHSLFAMENYGKYHALSLAFNDQKPHVFKKMTKDMTNIFSDWGAAMDLREVYKEPIKNAMEILRRAGRDDLVVKFDWIYEVESIINASAEEDDRLVICHGDCWNNNFMFKYQNNDEKQPSKMCFLDFQLSNLDSPVKDLCYNIYTTCDKSCLNQLDLLLETYYASLSRSVKSLGSDPDKLFTYEELKQHWKKYAKFGILLSSVLIRIALLDKCDAPDFGKICEEGKNIDHCFNVKLENEEEYNRRILDVFTHYGDRFL